MSASDQPRLPSSANRAHSNFVIGPIAQPKATKLTVVFGYMLTIEFLVAATATYFASMLYHYVSFGIAEFGGLPTPSMYIAQSFFIAAAFTIFSLTLRHFEMVQRQQKHIFLWSGIGTVAMTFAFFLSAIFLLKISTNYSRGAFIVQIVAVSIAICIDRAFLLLWFRAAISSGHIETSRAIVIGNHRHSSNVISLLGEAGTRIVGSFSFPPNFEFENARVDSETLAQNAYVRGLASECRALLADDIIVLAGSEDLVLASNIAQLLAKLPCNIHIVPRDDLRFLTRSQSVDFGHLKTLRLCRRPLSWVELAVKRTFDIVVSILAIIALSPLLVVTAIAIKLDSQGRVFFRQARHGYNNREIRILKFRTMSSAEGADGHFKPATQNDIRFTTFGRILRRYNIDELPQLFNVLSGEMSIIGPRPHATAHNQIFEDQILPFARRHNVKPGITGWAQVNGYRGPADTLDKMQKRIEYDLYYIDNWSFFFDLKIVLMTLFSKKAYQNAF
jgi:Undecaprenyl-phosphate glucose phosphotransferase